MNAPVEFPAVALTPRAGEPAVFVITVTRDGGAYSLDGFVCTFTITRSLDLPACAAEIQKRTGAGITHLPAAGQARIAVAAAELARLSRLVAYYWSVKMTDAAGTPITPEGLEGRLFLRASAAA